MGSPKSFKGEFSRTEKIDGKKLYAVFKEKDLKPTRLAEEIGVNQGYFSNCKYSGKISILVMSILESKYGIDRELYLARDEPEPEPETSNVVEVVTQSDFFTDENQQKLYKIIYSAVYSATKRALSE